MQEVFDYLDDLEPQQRCLEAPELRETQLQPPPCVLQPLCRDKKIDVTNLQRIVPISELRGVRRKASVLKRCGSIPRHRFSVTIFLMRCLPSALCHP